MEMVEELPYLQLEKYYHQARDDGEVIGEVRCHV